MCTRPLACLPHKSYNMSQHSVSSLLSELASGQTDFTGVVGARLSYLTFPPVTRLLIKWKTRMKLHTPSSISSRGRQLYLFSDCFWRILLLNPVGWTLFELDLRKKTQDAHTIDKTNLQAGAWTLSMCGVIGSVYLASISEWVERYFVLSS